MQVLGPPTRLLLANRIGIGTTRVSGRRFQNVSYKLGTICPNEVRKGFDLLTTDE